MSFDLRTDYMKKLKFNIDKLFYKMLLSLTLPIALQNLIGLGMNLTDTIMLGSLGDNQISASSLASQPFFIFTLFMFGLCSGACVLTAQYWGKNDTDTISKIMMLGMKASFSCAVVFSAVVIIFPEFVISLYTADQEVISMGAEYLRIIGFSYAISAISTTYLYVLRSVENVRIPLLINFTSFLVNVALNWVLIYGNLGFAAMGISGAATATLCARVVELIMVLIYASVFDKTLKLSLHHFLHTDMTLLKDFLRYSLPVVANETLWGLGISLQSVVIGHLGSEQVAAGSIAGIVQRLGMVVIFGMANAAAVIIGKQIGAGNVEQARRYSRKILLLSIGLGAVAAAFVFGMQWLMIDFYNVNALTKQYAHQMVMVYSVVILFQAFNTVNIVGVLRGGGDTRFAMVIDIATLWFVALPLGALAGLVFGLPLWIVFLLLLSDELAKFGFGIWRFRSGKWLTNVTR